MQFPFDNSYATLPETFFVRQNPTPVANPSLIKINDALACRLGLDPDRLRSTAGTAIFAGNAIPDGAAPLAQAYAGHQFGGWVPQLGDGRAVLLGEIIDRDGQRLDIQLKGAGRTPFSRGGDGRAWIGPVLREYVVSEAMAALGIPTTRALAAVTTGETVFRDRPLPGGIITRVASSHVRVGTFQFFAARGDVTSLRQLADYVIDRHYPEARNAANPMLAFLDGVVSAQATLIADWMRVGFIHGVMNTDNTSISGETIDYGPCAFMDTYHPDKVFSSIDHMGRYAYQMQPEIACWNLSCLASTLLPLIDENEDAAVEAATAVIQSFSPRFDAAWHVHLTAKIGIEGTGEDDTRLALDLLSIMADNKADFTLTFRRLSALAVQPTTQDLQHGSSPRDLFDDPLSFDRWSDQWRARLANEPRPGLDRQTAMNAVNPAYIARNHRVEEMIAAAVEGDLGPFETLLGVLSRPFDDQPENIAYQAPPKPDEVVRATFCGT